MHQRTCRQHPAAPSILLMCCDHLCSHVATDSTESVCGCEHLGHACTCNFPWISIKSISCTCIEEHAVAQTQLQLVYSHSLALLIPESLLEVRLQLLWSFSGTYSHGDKDKIEAEVGMFVKACTQQVEQLKQSVLAAQQPSLKQQQQQSPPRPPLSSSVAAHLHGVVRNAHRSYKNTLGDLVAVGTKMPGSRQMSQAGMRT